MPNLEPEHKYLIAEKKASSGPGAVQGKPGFGGEQELIFRFSGVRATGVGGIAAWGNILETRAHVFAFFLLFLVAFSESNAAVQGAAKRFPPLARLAQPLGGGGSPPSPSSELRAAPARGGPRGFNSSKASGSGSFLLRLASVALPRAHVSLSAPLPICRSGARHSRRQAWKVGREHGVAGSSTTSRDLPEHCWAVFWRWRCSPGTS